MMHDAEQLQPWEDGLTLVSENRSVSLLEFGEVTEVRSLFLSCWLVGGL